MTEKSVIKNLIQKLHGPNARLLYLMLVIGALVSALRGQDNWYDVINYHIYNPWALLNHRWSKDLFAAGIQGYFHPWLDVPYYLLSMVWMPGHPVIVALLAGLPYGVLLYVTLLITRTLLASLPGVGRTEGYVVMALVVLVATTGVSAWTQAGSTTNEVSVAAIVLFSVYLLLLEVARGRSSALRGSRLFVMGALLGLAAGFKLTSAVYAPAMGLVVLAVSPNIKAAIKAGFILTLGWVLTFGVVYGPWAWHLYTTTGSPMFPMFNNIFHSQYGAAVPTRDTVSVPKNLAQWIFYPVYWQDLHTPTAYNRLMFRDGRILFFYVAAVVYFIGAVVGRFRKTQSFVPRVLRVATVLCAVSYVIWLLMFAMLRYAVVIETLASVLSVLLVVCLVARIRSGSRVLVRVASAAAVVVLLMSTTVYPDVPRIPLGRKVFSADVPPLKPGAMVVLANQPMGLLAPLIQKVNEDAVFVGIPGCMAKGRWCYRDFYHYRLGQEMRDKVEAFRGPIYVAYYANRMPALPQLPLFRLRFDPGQCQSMSTNATANVQICAAHYVPKGQPMPQEVKPLKLAFRISYLAPGAELKADWLVNRCGTMASHGKLRVRWRAPDGVKRVQVMLKVPPNAKELNFASGTRIDSGTTGTWVRSAQTFLFKDYRSGTVFAEGTTEYVPCDDSQG